MPLSHSVPAGGRRRRLSAIAALALSATLLAGCSSSAPDSTTSGAGGPGAAPGTDGPAAGRAGWPAKVPTTGLSKGMVLPLEAYMETYPDSVAIEQAVDRLETRCMARYGINYTPAPPGWDPPPNNDDSNMGRRYGLMDRAQAAKLGYDLGDENRTPPQQPKLSAAAEAVLTGQVSTRPGAAKVAAYHGRAVPAGGCATEANGAIGADRIDTGLPGRLDAASLDRSQAEPRVRAAITAWSGCMKADGYTIDNPLNASRLAPDSDGRPAGKAAIAAAVADVDCKAKTGLVAVWFEVESSIQRQQVADNLAGLREVRDRIDAVVKAAAG
ncbi:hypothetical protein [Streptomyces sp. CA-111067]|uniref:hypothetical protein n=1 Tax=Streptomyces sp. CA-111067 TaxID=3240046 RepID=UPI003D9A096C